MIKISDSVRRTRVSQAFKVAIVRYSIDTICNLCPQGIHTIDKNVEQVKRVSDMRILWRSALIFSHVSISIIRNDRKYQSVRLRGINGWSYSSKPVKYSSKF